MLGNSSPPDSSTSAAQSCTSVTFVTLIIAYLDSFTFCSPVVEAEMKDLSTPYSANSSGPNFATFLKELITTDYRVSDDCHSLVVVQSSGTGKTRGSLELISNHFYGVYILCSDIANGWMSNANSFAAEFKRAQDKSHFCVLFLQQLGKEIHEMISDDKSIGEVCSMQFSKNTIYETVVKRIVKRVVETGKDTKLSVESKKALKSNDDAIKRAQHAQQGGDDLSDEETASSERCSGPRIVVVFDEAQGLCQLAGDEINAYRLMLQALEAFDNIVGIFMSTSSKLTEIYSYKQNCTSLRPAMFKSRKRLPPIFQVYNSDIDESHPFLLGRPLWSSLMQSKTCITPARLITIAAAKLLGSEISYLHGLQQISPSSEQSNNQHLALLFCRFGLQPVNTLAAEFVCGHMSWLTAVDEDAKTCTAIYTSEPVLAEASACVTAFNKKFPFTSLMKTLSANIQNNIVPKSVGDGGEIAAAIAMACCIDDLRKIKLMGSMNPHNVEATVAFEDVYAKKLEETTARSMSMDIPVLSFLDALYGQPSKFSSPTVNTRQLEGWNVNFSHFIRLPGILTADAVKIGAQRCTAFYVRKGGDGVDIVVPVFTRRLDGTIDRVTALKVQVKNYAGDIGLTETENLLKLLGPAKCEPLNMDEDLPSILMLFMIGDGCATLKDRRKKGHPGQVNELLFAGNQIMIVLNFRYNGGWMYHHIEDLCASTQPQDQLIRLGSQYYSTINSSSSLFNSPGLFLQYSVHYLVFIVVCS
jgi:hypothetical protein